MKFTYIFYICFPVAFSFNVASAQVEEDTTTVVSDKRIDDDAFASAVGYYARSRHFIIKAIQEFDAGVAYVDPSVLINISQWRNTLIDKAEDLERILTPQPLADPQGVIFNPDQRFINKDYLQIKSLKKFGTPIKLAKKQTLKVSTKHFSIARSLLIKAVQEFDLGLKNANPQILVDVHNWRNTILNCAEDLNRVLAPQSRESESGTAFSPDSRLLNSNIR